MNTLIYRTATIALLSGGFGIRHPLRKGIRPDRRARSSSSSAGFVRFRLAASIAGLLLTFGAGYLPLLMVASFSYLLALL